MRRFAIGCAVVVLLVMAIAIVQGIGQVLGGGMAEYLVR